jgi:hypothetical protein
MFAKVSEHSNTMRSRNHFWIYLLRYTNFLTLPAIAQNFAKIQYFLEILSLSGLKGSKKLHYRSNFRVLVILRPKILHFCSIVLL